MSTELHNLHSQPDQPNGAQPQDQGKGQGTHEVLPAGRTGPHARSAQGGNALPPPVDIFEDENGFVLIADMPGVAKEQLVVRVTGDNVLVEGAATIPVGSPMELVCGEIRSPLYRRSFTLSGGLDPARSRRNRLTAC